MTLRTSILIMTCWIGCAAAESRDPFWPIGYTRDSAPRIENPGEEAAPAQPTRVLTDEELRKLAEQEANKIKEILDRKATAVFGGRVHALVNGRWVTRGDSLTVETLGNTYRLEILTLTTDNIELEPHRSRPGNSGTN